MAAQQKLSDTAGCMAASKEVVTVIVPWRGAHQEPDRNAYLDCVFVARKYGDCSTEAGRTCQARPSH